MGSTPICTIDATGCHKPAFADGLNYFTSGFQHIFGADIVLDNSSQDGQFVGLLALALDDVNSEALAAYNSFSPNSALGTGLSSLIKLNGIRRKVPSFSTSDLLLVGVFGTVITNGIVNDKNGNPWALPASVTIPLAGQITATAICQTIGAIAAPAGTISSIQTIVPGWQSATNLADASPGAPVETDSQVRQRQTISTELPAQTNLDSVIGAVAAIPNVTFVSGLENDSFAPDANTIPGHCIAIVVTGGDDTAIATAIQLKKAPGGGTYGTTSITLLSRAGIPHTYRFFRPAQIPITYHIIIKAFVGFTSDIEAQIQKSISDWTNALGAGTPLLYRRAYMPAQLFGGLNFNTFELLSLAVARDGGTPTQADVSFLFNEQPFSQPSFVTIEVTT